MQCNRVKKFLKILFIPIITLLFCTILYVLVSVLLSLIPVNKNSPDLQNEKYIYLATNGVHLDIVLPVTDSTSNWFHFLEIDEEIRPFAKYLSFGWGDREFYINTSEWSDLKLKVAFQAVFLKGSSAMHVSPYRNISEGENVLKIPISSLEYQKLTEFIFESFKKNQNGSLLKINVEGYKKYDSFYEATRNYNLFYTCNSWVNEAFKASGMKACLWTPSDKGLFHQYKKLLNN